jgi:hypothetical protein
MRRDVSAELEHDLSVPSQRNRAQIATPALPPDEGKDRGRRPEAGNPMRADLLSPESEEIAESRAAAEAHLDNPGRIERPERIGAAAGYDPRKIQPGGFRDSDRSRHDHDLPSDEQLEVDAESSCPAGLAAEAPDALGREYGLRSGPKAVAGPDADRPRLHVGRQRRPAQDEGKREK